MNKMLESAAGALATGFGLGKSPIAPGTAGALLGVPIVLILHALTASMSPAARLTVQVGVAIALSLIAIPICDVGEKRAGKKDPHIVVADEYMTFPICMIGLPLSPWWVLPMAFVVNRMFDILKPPPANRLQQLPGGLGIVIDDVFASVYALVLNHLLFYIGRRALGLG